MNILKPLFLLLLSILLLSCHTAPPPPVTSPPPPQPHSEWVTQPTGEIVCREYLGDKLDGETRVYSSDSTLQRVSHWILGVRNGNTWEQSTPYPDQECIITAEWENGVQVGVADSSEGCGAPQLKEQAISFFKQIANLAVSSNLSATIRQQAESYIGAHVPEGTCKECIGEITRGGAFGAKANIEAKLEMILQVPELLAQAAMLAQDKEKIKQLVNAQIDSLLSVDWVPLLQQLPQNITEFAWDARSEILADASLVAPEMENYHVVGYVVGWLAAEYALNKALFTALGGDEVRMVQSLPATTRYRIAANRSRTRMFERFRIRNQPSSHLPEKHGTWKGNPGNSGWTSDLDEVRMVTKGKAVPFRNSKPDFSSWSEGGYVFQKGELNGTNQDFNRIYRRIAQQKRLSSEREAQSWLRKKGLTPHHVDDRQIQLIPAALHENIPHTGGAAFLRVELAS